MLLLQLCDAGIDLGVSGTSSPTSRNSFIEGLDDADCCADDNSRPCARRACFSLPRRTCALAGILG